MLRRIASVILLIAIFQSSSIRADSGLLEESIKIPAVFENFWGKYTANLDAIVVRPNDDQQHPLAIINHGKPYDQFIKNVLPKGERHLAIEFAKRGWVAIAFTRRGFGLSEGMIADRLGGNCSDYETVGKESSDDIREVMRLMKEKPYVDGSKIIAIGQSAGGFATVALTADPPPGLVAAINFAGGHGSSGPTASTAMCNEPAVLEALSGYGKTSRIPMLWVYAANDHYFAPSVAQDFYKAFTETGGNAEFIAAPPFGKDGHHLFSIAGMPIWTKYVDRFLEKHDLKLREDFIAYDENVVFPEGLKEGYRPSFLEYLDASGHKAFVMSSNGGFNWVSRKDSAEWALEQALNNCQAMAHSPCHPVLIDDRMVSK